MLDRWNDLQKTSTLTCLRNGIKEEQYGQNHGCKGPNIDTRWTYNKGQLFLREAFMISSTSGPWAWTQSSRSTPTSSRPNLSFTSRLRRSCRAENYLVKHQNGMTCVNLRVHTVFREGIGSIHWGVLETYTSNFKCKITSSKVEYGYQAEDTNYQRHYISMEMITRLLNMKDTVG